MVVVVRAETAQVKEAVAEVAGARVKRVTSALATGTAISGSPVTIPDFATRDFLTRNDLAKPTVSAGGLRSYDGSALATKRLLPLLVLQTLEFHAFTSPVARLKKL